MSKFSERLSGLGQPGPARMGFGRSGGRVKNPVMLLIGRGGDPEKDAASVDLLLLDPGKTGGSEGWGAVVDGGKAPDLEKLQKDGCQFVLVSSEDAAAEVLLSEELGVGIPVSDGLDDSRIRAIEDGPFEFLLYSPASVSWPLSVGAVLGLQELISSYSKHIFLELPSGAGLPGEKDLEVLKNLPVSAIVLDMAKAKAGDAAKLKESIAKLEPRKPSARSERSSPLVPMAGRGSSDDGDSGDAGFEDDDDWED